MAKFKVGDRVRMLKCNDHEDQSHCEHGTIGDVWTIKSVGEGDYPYKMANGGDAGWSDEELELVTTATRRASNMNIVTLAKLNPAQRKLYKAGLVGEDGNLTEDGKSLVLEHFAAKPDIQKYLLEAAKNIKCVDKKEDC